MNVEFWLAVFHFQLFQKGVTPLLVSMVSYDKSIVIGILVFL